MAFCENDKIWSMTLSLDSNPSLVERLAFDLLINGHGVITGTVRDSTGETMSRLRGRCEFFSHEALPAVAIMSFIFRIRRGQLNWGVHLSGLAFNPTGQAVFNPSFRGHLRTFTPDLHTPPSEGSGEMRSLTLLGDPGDTGTGTGTQT